MIVSDLVIELDSAVLGEEELSLLIALVASVDTPSDAVAPARGIFVGTLFGSAFWLGALALLHALPF